MQCDFHFNGILNIFIRICSYFHVYLYLYLTRFWDIFCWMLLECMQCDFHFNGIFNILRIHTYSYVIPYFRGMLFTFHVKDIYIYIYIRIYKWIYTLHSVTIGNEQYLRLFENQGVWMILLNTRDLLDTDSCSAWFI